MTPAVFNFKDLKYGGWFTGIQMDLTKVINEVESALDLTGATIVLEVKKSSTSFVSKAFTIGYGITVLDAINGSINIDEFEVTLSPYKYIYTFKITLSGGVEKTYLEGLFEVYQ